MSVRSFWLLVNQFGILRRPMSMSMHKISSIVTCLMNLHYFYINNEGKHCRRLILEDEQIIHRMSGYMNNVIQAFSISSTGSWLWWSLDIISMIFQENSGKLCSWHLINSYLKYNKVMQGLRLKTAQFLDFIIIEDQSNDWYI